jgi:integrase
MSPARGSRHRYPKAITPTDVQRLLESWEISDPAGLRDYPIIMLVARFGLRSIEAARQ